MISSDAPRRVVITAVGMVLPVGKSLAEVQDAMHQEPAFCASDADPEVSVCPVRNFDLKTYTGRFKNARYLSRGQQFALAAAVQAIRNSDLPRSALAQCGLFLGLGPNLEACPKQDKALWLLDFLPNSAASAISQVLGILGENSTIMTACAASTQALGQAYHAIRFGITDCALAGGGDSRLSPQGVHAYKSAGVLAHGDPQTACRPFDTARTGFAIGEGGAMFVLESLEHATTRQAPILAEILGAASTLDGMAMTTPDAAGERAEAAVRRAMGKQVKSACVLAHGTGTLLNDAMEADLIHRTNPDACGIQAFKSWIGHLAAACGAAELALGLACCQNGFFPAIRNLATPCRDDLPFLRQPCRMTPHTMVLQNFGFGGQNACLVLRPC